MKKRIFFISLFVLSIVGIGVFAYAKYGSVTAERETRTASYSESGAIVNKALSAPQFPSKTSDENGITVTVTPLLVSSDAATWKFDVVMSTHAVELGSYNLKDAAALADGTGRIYKPVSWQPDATEGHHIGGILVFDRPVAESKTVIVAISGIGGSSERIYTWNIIQ